jgi:hypothetical protein
MNERIKELMKQSMVEYQFDLRFSPEKFAELIVKETISVLQKRFMGDLNREDMEVRRCIADIQKHFGVEE